MNTMDKALAWRTEESCHRNTDATASICRTAIVVA